MDVNGTATTSIPGGDSGIDGKFIVVWTIFYVVILVFLYCCFGRNFFSMHSDDERIQGENPSTAQPPAAQVNRSQQERSSERIFVVTFENAADCSDQAPPYKLEDLPPSYEDALRRIKQFSELSNEGDGRNVAP